MWKNIKISFGCFLKYLIYLFLLNISKTLFSDLDLRADRLQVRSRTLLLGSSMRGRLESFHSSVFSILYSNQILYFIKSEPFICKIHVSHVNVFQNALRAVPTTMILFVGPTGKPTFATVISEWCGIFSSRKKIYTFLGELRPDQEDHEGAQWSLWWVLSSRV